MVGVSSAFEKAMKLKSFMSLMMRNPSEIFNVRSEFEDHSFSYGLAEIVKKGIDFDDPKTEDLEAAFHIMDVVERTPYKMPEIIDLSERYAAQALTAYSTILMHTGQIEGHDSQAFIGFAQKCKQLTQDDIIRLGFETDKETLFEENETLNTRLVYDALRSGCRKKGFSSDGREMDVFMELQKTFWKEFEAQGGSPENIDPEETVESEGNVLTQ